MDFNEYQEKALSFSILEGKQETWTYGLMNMSGEVGEIHSKHAKSIRDKTQLNIDDIKKELGDVLWSMAAYADGLGFTLEEVALLNIEKLEDRTKRNVIGGSGDDR